MGRCSRCGGPAPGNMQGEICPICRQKMQAEQYAKQKEFDNRYGNSSRNSTGYQPSANSWQVNASTYKRSSGVMTLIFIAIAIIGAFLGVRYWNYTSFENSLINQSAIDEVRGDDSDSFVNEIINRKNAYPQWSLSITKMPDDYISSIFDFISEKTVNVKHWTEDGVESYYFRFYSGFDMGTGLTGKFYLTTVDGEKCLISEKDNTVYQEGSAFFSEHYEQLMAMTYDAVVPELTKQLIGGEFGTNDTYGNTVVKRGTVFASVYEDTGYTRIVNDVDKARMSYVLTFSKNVSECVPDISDYEVVAE